MLDERVRIYRFEPYADHLAVVLSDAEATEGVFDGDTWDKADEAWRIAVERHCVVIGTARYDYVLVKLDIWSAPPVYDPLDAYDHVAESDVEFPSGKLTVTGATQVPEQVEPIPVPAGRYRVRVGYLPTGQRPSKFSETDPGDHLEYRVTMWPTVEERGVRILKQGSSPWAY
ncbi:hypothetical protein [Micromonospora sp. A202]|uniref:hypothetical protein n=1 Tax=Micromonospora sp. A202 TaxID=2572899 RepID=UPI001153F95E|nr:hypothetical protein [Micromonospora sp. A202]